MNRREIIDALKEYAAELLRVADLLEPQPVEPTVVGTVNTARTHAQDFFRPTKISVVRKRKPHWTQRPENRAKVARVARAMRKGQKAA